MPQQGPSNVAGLEVQVPSPDAEVWLQGQKVSGSGTTRRFYSPPLDPQKTYTYTVNAAWYENGELRTQRQQVDIRADSIARVDFTQDSQMAKRDAAESGQPAPPPPRAEERTAARPDTGARDESLPPPPPNATRVEPVRERPGGEEPARDAPAKDESLPQPKLQGEKDAPPIDGPKAEPARDDES
jgi:uncharacterized protein (TIGR03000 family)